MKVGFIGLGRMGKGMARRILGGGHDLAVYDIVREATTELGAAGARIASSVSDVSKGRDVVITMLVEDESVINVVLGPGGLRDSFPPGSIHLAMGKYGVAPQVMYDVMTDGLFAGAPAYKGYGKTMVDETYDKVGSPVQVGIKDANLILAAADLARVPLPTLDIYRDRLLGAIAHGDGNKDQAVLAREQARACGLE